MAAANAQAYFTANGNGAGNSNAGTLGAPTLSGTPGAGTATLTWSSVSPPASGSVSYYVKRNGGNPGGNCPTSAAPSAVLTCTDSGLAAGTYSYTVTAVWRTWTAASSPVTQVTLASGAFDHFVLSAATTTPTAGQSDNLTITAKDTAGNTVTAYGGSNNLTFSGASTIGSFRPTVTNSGGTATNFGSATAINFTNGVATVSGSSNGAMILYKVETANIVVSDGTHTNGAGLAITVGPAAVSSFTFPTPATQTAGTGFNVSITALDAYGNTATGYSGAKSVVFSGPANSPGGTAPSYPASVTFTSGVATTVPITLYNAASTTLTATEAGKSGSTGAFTVNPAGINSFSLPTPATQTAGTAFNLTSITALDAYGNTATGYSGAKSVVFSGPANSPGGTAPSYPASVTFTSGVATTVPITLYNAASTTLTATEAGKSGSTGAFTVNPAGINLFSLAAATTTPTAGAADSLTITAKDAYGNTATGYSGSHSLTFSGASAIGTHNPTVTNSSGTAVNFGTATAVTFTNGVSSAGGVMRLYKSGAASITVAEGGSYTSNAVSVTVSSAPPSSFTVTNPGTRTAGTAFTVTLTASNDAYGNAPTSYAGTQCIAFSGPTASPNGTAPLYPQGSCPVGQSAVTFNASGVGTLAGVVLYDATNSTTLTATDTVNGVTGTSGAFTVNGLATMGSFVLTAATTTPTAGAADQLTIQAADVYGNSITSYTGQHTLTFSGAGMAGTVHPTVTDRTGTAVNFGTAESITFTNGASSAGGIMRLYRAGTAQIVVTDGTYNNGSGLAVTVSPATASGLALSATQAVVTPGEADNLTVRAIDAYGNTAPSYTGTHNLTFSGASVNGAQNPTVSNNSGTAVNFGTAESITFANGVSTVSGSSNGVMRLYKLETAHLVVTDGTYTSASLSIVVSNVTASMVSAGGFHTCALVAGTVECWGDNESGELGNNTTTNSSSPVMVKGVGGTGTLSGVTQISAGKYHTCALVSGSVYCWGENDYGELGNNSTTDSWTPVQVRLNATTYLTGVTQVSASGKFTCALLSTGTVRCWGHNQYGQLGNGNTNDSSIAVQVSGITNAIQVTNGANQACALLSDNTVKCWGYNNDGQLGDGSTTNRSTPVQVVGASGSGSLTGVSVVSGGRLHTCALLSGGTVYCWGDNGNGELGDGTTTNRSLPVRVGSITNASTISAGEYHSCAVLSDGTAQCWGASAYGQVGDGTTADTSTPVTVIGPGGWGSLTGIAAISAGGADINETDDYEHTCALTSDGTVVCWGQNNYGQLGNGTTTMSVSPVAVALL
jgi:alpha-tubulin suppressor-like RCC1 family protein